MFVRNIDGTDTAYNCSGELKCLKSCIYEKTGIPQDFQQLYFGNKLVTEDMVAIIPNGSNINVCVRLMGGGNSCEYAMKRENISVISVMGKCSAQIAVVGSINILIVALTILLSYVQTHCPVSLYMKLIVAIVVVMMVVVMLNSISMTLLMSLR